jgi:hypothetical protein
MRELAAQRPVFHSEADFQHALSGQLQTLVPNAVIHLERSFQTDAGQIYVDILLNVGERVLAIELKYKTRALIHQSGTETFVLQNHGAQPPNRYDVLKDLARLELLSSLNPCISGCFIFLTNDSAYWSKPRSDTDTSAAFSLYDGRTVSGRMEWAARTSPGTNKYREKALELRSAYTINWREYSMVEAQSYANFRYFALEVLPG